jgi:hypothetical protein
MQTARKFLRSATFCGLAVAILFVVAGCERKKVAARAQPTTVLKWKHTPQNTLGIPKGIVVEQHGDHIHARLCDLDPSDGFVIDSILSHGAYLPDQKAIIFPLGMPDSANVEHWLMANGPHMSVPFDPQAKQLHGNLSSSGASQSFQFARYNE